MTHYNIKLLKSAVNSYTTFINPRKENCSKLHRCNDFRECPTCSAHHRKKRLKKLTSHLTESVVKSYKYKYLITFTSSIIDFNYSALEKNSDINIFTSAFIKAKRLKNFVINKNSQYILNKEISYSKESGYNPHTHMILLSDKKFNINDKKLKELQSLSNIDIHVENIYPINNSYKESIKKIFNYINKFNSDNAKLNRETKILKGEHSNKHTSLFNKNNTKLFKSRLLNHFKKIIDTTKPHDIAKVSKELYINIIEEEREKITLAKQIFKRNKNKKHTKNYLRLLKSLKKKLSKIKTWRKRQIYRLKAVR